MNNFTSILLSLACFLAVETVPMSNAYACGKTKSCCKRMTKKGCKGKCCCIKDLQKNQTNKQDKDCGGNCNGKSCPCPQSSNIQFGNISSQFDLSLPTIFLSVKEGWYYIQKNPKPGFIFIWLKPKISSLFIV